MPTFIIKGKSYNLSNEDVIKALRNVEPEPIVKHCVKIGDKEYPIKQALAETLNISRIGFTSMYAYQILTKLGFEVYEKK